MLHMYRDVKKQHTLKQTNKQTNKNHNPYTKHTQTTKPHRPVCSVKSSGSGPRRSHVFAGLRTLLEYLESLEGDQSWKFSPKKRNKLKTKSSA